MDVNKCFLNGRVADGNRSILLESKVSKDKKGLSVVLCPFTTQQKYKGTVSEIGV